MKKHLKKMIVACALVMTMPVCAVCESLSALRQIELSVRIYNPGGTNGDKPRTPLYIPAVYIEENVLSFEIPTADFVLQLRNEEGVAYEIPVPAGTQEICLPEDLTGSYELLLIFGGYSFVGEVTL